ncbi:MFS transporter [Rhodococcus ruber]|uniref:MFS transporter n=1 Tax=Rhodococcus ruber TaxID=1830 RepID=UPI00265AEE1C|nr:MFS transporter [Rhodococcus ruber]WKK12510.1 MFS transporter [Rhodococcus ruber]
MAVETRIPSVGERPAPRGLVAVLSLCGIVVALMHTLVVPLLPQLPHLLGTSVESASWAVTATLLASAVITPVSGRLGDMFGKRRMLLVCLGTLVVGSAVCALSTTLWPMITGRALQGAASGAIPLGIAILRDELRPRRLPGAMATISATMGVGGAVGFPVAAAVAQIAHWHTLFWFCGLVGVLAAALVLWVVPESPRADPGRFDLLGAIGLAVALTLFLLPVTKGSTWGWTAPATLAMFAGAAATAVAWGRYELRRPRPLVDLRVSGRRPVLFTNLASVAVGFALYSNSLAFPQLLMAPVVTGYGFGLSMVATGLVLAPSGLVMMALSPVSARITTRYGPRTTLAAGAVVVYLGYLLAYVACSEIWHIVVAAMIIGAGIGLAYAAMPALIMTAVPLSETAAANSLNALMRSVGTSSSAAVVSVLLAADTLNVGTATVPALDAFRATFLVAALAAVVGLALTVAVPRSRPGGLTRR